MGLENRQNTRYKDIGRVMAPEISSLSAILDDISAEGCKIHYTCPVVAELETEYEIEISPSKNQSNNNNPLHLICVPQWVNEIEGQTHIGFKILYSPDANNLAAFISQLEAESNEDDLDIV